MGKTKKLIELDNNAIKILEKQAKLQKRSLKNYLEYMLEDTAIRFSEPSEEYKAMIDDVMDRYDRGELEMYDFEDVMKEYEQKS